MSHRSPTDDRWSGKHNNRRLQAARTEDTHFLARGRVHQAGLALPIDRHEAFAIGGKYDGQYYW
jgi:hypothetical protein